MARDSKAWAAAEEISHTANRGEDIVLEAAKLASENMAKMIANIKSKDGKIESLRAHALELGVAAQLRQHIIPHANVMVDELKEIGTSENEAKVLSEIWLAKVVREVVRQLNEQE